ncbi:YozQ family protein [Sediminibacillus albus]|uniref:DUF4025 domain-containing protein n=1 Tax=Sediminibacillus albus TaxID=407036 RepID=A0A1G8YTP9_9BACI|nr:YozQ family protein [Sediminibacillus albus]SDK06232.1 Protein of unknown function [Sediminibacillus albus]
MDKNKKVSNKDAEKVAEKMYDPSDYQKDDQLAQGLSITHEQASDNYTEGTIEGEIDQVGQDGNLVSHKGKNKSNNKIK